MASINTSLFYSKREKHDFMAVYPGNNNDSDVSSSDDEVEETPPMNVSVSNRRKKNKVLVTASNCESDSSKY